MGVRDKSDADAQRVDRSQHGRYILVEQEMLTLRPLFVDLPSASIETRSGAAHLLDDVARVLDEEFRLVNVFLSLIEQR